MRCVSVRRTNLPVAGPGKARVLGPSTINAPNQPTCSARYAPSAEPALPSCCPLATPRPCSSISTKSQRKSPPAHTPFSFSIKLDGTAPKTSRLPKTSRSCRCRRVRQSSTLKKTSGSSCGRTGCRTAFSNPSTKSSTTAATRGTRSSINRGKSCPSLAAIGQSPVNHCEGWYKLFDDGEKYYALLVERVAEKVKEGKSLDDIKKDVKMPEYANWASQDRMPTNIEAAYTMI